MLFNLKSLDVVRVIEDVNMATVSMNQQEA